jgi:hypothetical protein
MRGCAMHQCQTVSKGTSIYAKETYYIGKRDSLTLAYLSVYVLWPGAAADTRCGRGRRRYTDRPLTRGEQAGVTEPKLLYGVACSDSESPSVFKGTHTQKYSQQCLY